MRVCKVDLNGQQLGIRVKAHLSKHYNGALPKDHFLLPKDKGGIGDQHAAGDSTPSECEHQQ